MPRAQFTRTTIELSSKTFRNVTLTLYKQFGGITLQHNREAQQIVYPGGCCNNYLVVNFFKTKEC